MESVAERDERLRLARAVERADDRVSKIEARMDTHEAVCTQRYVALELRCDSIERMQKLTLYAIGALAAAQVLGVPRVVTWLLAHIGLT